MPEKLHRNTDFWDPSLYLDKAAPQFNLALNILKNYSLKGNETILDIGCGPGNITALLAKQVPQGKVIGIDSAQKMVTFANEKYHDLKNLSFEKRNVLDFSYPHKFDLIVSFSALHWVINQKVALANIYKHLAKNGSLLVVMIPSRKVEPVSAALSKLIETPSWHPYFESFRPPPYYGVSQEKYQQLLKNTGFEIVFFNENKTPVPFDSKEALANWFESWLAHRQV
ncbi:MAG: trans-aconitate 2-methyltransferase, partial [Candidatus Berkiella sp.]